MTLNALETLYDLALLCAAVQQTMAQSVLLSNWTQLYVTVVNDCDEN